MSGYKFEFTNGPFDIERAIAKLNEDHSNAAKARSLLAELQAPNLSSNVIETNTDPNDPVRIMCRDTLAVLRAIDCREAPFRYVGATWDEVYAGDVEFEITDGPHVGWTIVIFNDCDEWDYLDHAIAPDGRRIEFDDYFRLVDDARDEDRNALCAFAPKNEAVWETGEVRRVDGRWPL